MQKRRCQKACCQHSDSDGLLKLWYNDWKVSSNKIAERCGSSPPHILSRLHELGIVTRTRSDYPPSGGGLRPRVHPFWKIKPKTFHERSVRELLEMHNLSTALWSVRYAYKIRKVILEGS